MLADSIARLASPLVRQGSLDMRWEVGEERRREAAEYWQSLMRDGLTALLTRNGEATYYWEATGTGLKKGPVAPHEAEAHFTAGGTLYLHEFPEAEQVAAEIATVVGLPRECVRASLFLSNGAYVTPRHFDHVDVIVVQLLGEKTWTLHSNTLLEEPTAFAKAGENAPLELPYAGHDFAAASSALDEPHPCPLLPGDALVVPRGCWHEVSSSAASASLHVQFVAPRHADLVLELVKAHLDHMPQMRAPAFELFGNAGMTVAQRLVTDLVGQMSSLTPGVLLSRTGATGLPHPRRWRRSPFADFQTQSRSSEDEVLVALRYRGRKQAHITEVGLSAPVHGLLCQVAQMPVDCSFTAADFNQHECSPGEVEELLAVLEDARFLDPAYGEPARGGAVRPT